MEETITRSYNMSLIKQLITCLIDVIDIIEKFDPNNPILEELKKILEMLQKL